MKKSRLLLTAIPLMVFVSSMPSRGGEDRSPRLLTKETFMEMETVRSPVISPDGKQIIFTRGWIDQLEDRSRSNLWIIDTKGERVRELTHGNWSDSSPVWSPDGERIAFISDRDETRQIHVMWLDTREVAQLTHLQRAPGNLKWSPDGTQLAFTSFVPDKDTILSVKLPPKPEGAKWAKPAVIIDRLNWRRDGSGYREPGYQHVFALDAVLGGTPRQITQGDYNHNSPEWSHDGRYLYVSAIRKPDADYLRGDSEIYKIDMESLETEALTQRTGPDRSPKVSGNGKWIAYAGYDDQHFTSHLSSIYLMDQNGEDNHTLIGDLPNSPGNLTWASDDSGVYFTIGERGSVNFYFVSVKGKVKKASDGVHTLSGLSISKSGQVATVRSSFKDPGSLVTFSMKSPKKMRTLVDVNADVLRGVALADVEELWFTSEDGLDIQGWLVHPVDFDPAQKYPLVLWIHGGPWSMYTVGFNWSFQNFAAEGYAVLYTNPRGSTGYGQDFVNGIQYAYPGRDFDDLMAGVDAALEREWIDAENLFVCGGSGGGVLTAWIVGHTDRFAAAASMRPVINWHSFVGTTDGASWYDQFRRFPWEDPLEYSLRSPLSYVGHVTTPVMIMTGESDLRTPIGQSEEYYRALKRLKKETLLVRMPEEYHGWRRPSHRLLQQLYLQAWFEKHRTGNDEEPGETDDEE